LGGIADDPACQRILETQQDLAGPKPRTSWEPSRDSNGDADKGFETSRLGACGLRLSARLFMLAVKHCFPIRLLDVSCRLRSEFAFASTASCEGQDPSYTYLLRWYIPFPIACCAHIEPRTPVLVFPYDL